MATPTATEYHIEKWAEDRGVFSLFQSGSRNGGVNAETLSADKDLEFSSEFVQLLDGAGNRDVNLPKHKKGVAFIIVNTGDSGGSETLTVKDDSGSTVVSLADSTSSENNQWSLVASDGSSWHTLGVLTTDLS